jgi:3-hydroxybutyryl-CoA dehydrogenase
MSNLGVIGAGLMGSEIALVHALAGHKVLLADRTESLARAGVERLATLLDKGITRGFYTIEQRDAALDLICATADLQEFSSCTYLTEAVYEDEAVKSEVLAALDSICSPECVFASNTSTIPISTLASKLDVARRNRFIGTHYFSPVSRMKLVEVIPAFGTSRSTVEATMAHCMQLGKVPIVVKDVAGFAVNRMLHAFMIEAVRLVEENVASPEDIDTACRLGLGHAMGPFDLMDAVSSSLCVQAQSIMQEAYGERFRPRPLLKQRVRAGFVGGKGKPGWKTVPRA